MNIKAGMMVEIVDTKITLGANVGLDDTAFLGHVGRVLRPCNRHADAWDIEGAERSSTGNARSFYSGALRPIPDQQELSSWEAIQELTKWHPQKIEA